jgi:hypothetical protein
MMVLRSVPPPRSRAIAVAAVFAALVALPLTFGPVGRAATDAQLSATLSLPEGDVHFDLEPGTFHRFDEDGASFIVQVIDGCAVNGRYWIFGAGLGPEDMTLTVFDQQSGRSDSVVLPRYEPGGTIGTVLAPEALDICRGGPAGGLPEVAGTATLTSVTDRCSDDVETVALLSEGRNDGYRALVRDGTERDRVIRESPIAVVDDRADGDSLLLLAEGRTPRQVEGVLFSGPQGMLPKQAALDKALDGIARSRVRRAFEAAKSSTPPEPLMRDLGLHDVACVFHVGLDLQTPGAAAYLQQAGWIAEGARPILPPQPVEPRFDVALVSSEGTTTPLPLTGPLEGTPAAGRLWVHEGDRARVEIVDACDLTDTYWTIAAAVTEEPLELVITDRATGTAVTQLLWTDRDPVSRLTDTTSLPFCS